MRKCGKVLSRRVVIVVPYGWVDNGVEAAAENERELSIYILSDTNPGYYICFVGNDVTDDDLNWLQNYMMGNGETPYISGGLR